MARRAMLAALRAVCAGAALMGFFLGALLGGTLLLGAEIGTVEPAPVLAALQNERGYVAADLIVAAPVSDSGNEIAIAPTASDKSEAVFRTLTKK